MARDRHTLRAQSLRFIVDDFISIFFYGTWGVLMPLHATRLIRCEMSFDNAFMLLRPVLPVLARSPRTLKGAAACMPRYFASRMPAKREMRQPRDGLLGSQRVCRICRICAQLAKAFRSAYSSFERLCVSLWRSAL